MGRKENTLIKILTENDVIELANDNLPSIVNSVLHGNWKDEILKVYKQLGGKEEAYAVRGKCKWDIITTQYIIELDEQLHFNDYRLIILSSPVYSELKAFPLDAYRNYCMLYKENCLHAGSYGKKWTNNSCEKMFGSAQSIGDLSGNGSPRWKQRAFYDFVKDVSQLVTNIPVVRLSIYDIVEYQGRKYKLGDLLESDFTSSRDAASGIQKLINERI